MSGFMDREKNRKKSVVASMIENPSEPNEKSVGRGRPKESRETKRRVTLAVLPSVYENVQKIAYIDRTSVSEVVTTYFEQYIKDNINKIEEYDKLKQE